MRHQKAGRKLSRTSSHRHAMFSNMVASLILHGRIETTDPKAKELKRIADRTISWGTSVADLGSKVKAKKDYAKLSAADRARMVHAQRMAARVVRQPEALHKLFYEVAPLLKGRAGGFTRVLKTRFRRGDAAPMSFVELVARPEEAVAEAPPAAEGGKKGKKGDKGEKAKQADE
jgi:large subunit ribosomal protein L17